MDEILRLIPYNLSQILSFIFNLSIETGKFISILKTARVVPVFKNKGSPLEVGNYRPISLLSNIDKIFEKIVHSRLISYFDKFNIINNNQFGFRSKHSTCDALITITEQIRKSLDKSHFSCGTFIDLQKEFDTVDHEILLSKLEHYGIRGIFNQWLRDYLSGRKQFVSILNHSSLPALILYGVPQGSVLGPLLFLIYINDLPFSIPHSTIFLFADDTSLLYSHPNLQIIEEKVNSDLYFLSEWLTANKIALNNTKTEVILFRDPRKAITYPVTLFLDNIALSFSTHVKYLGVILDEHLSFKAHTDSLCKKLSKSNAIIAKLRHFLNTSELISVYFALFQSHLTYGLQVYGPNLSVYSRVHSLQKTALRLITFSDSREHSRPLFETLDILTIPELLFVSNISIVHRTLNHLTPRSVQNSLSLSYHSHSYPTRCTKSKLLQRPNVKTEHYGINSIHYKSILNWNALQSNFTDINLVTVGHSRLKRLAISFLRP